LHQFVGWIAGSWGAVPGVLAALVVVVVSVFFAHKARADAGRAAWFLVPVLLFAVIPTGVRLWGFFASERPLWTTLWESLPFVVGFLIPVGTLLVVYSSLGRWKRQHEKGA